MTEWQPIETAPKDGTPILVYGGTQDREEETRAAYAVAWWLAGEPGYYSHWRFACYDSGYYGHWEDPTHWMPLPAPPKETT